MPRPASNSSNTATSCSWECSEWGAQSSTAAEGTVGSPSNVEGNSSNEAVCDARSDWACRFNPLAASRPACLQPCMFTHVHASFLRETLSFAHTQLDKLRRVEVMVMQIMEQLPKLRRELKKARLQVRGLQKHAGFHGRHRGPALLRKFKATKTKVAVQSKVYI